MIEIFAIQHDQINCISLLVFCTNGIKPNLFEYPINLTKLTFLKLEQRLN